MRIELLKPHTHVGKFLQPGDTLDLDADLADWLIREGAAKEIQTESLDSSSRSPHLKGKPQ